MINNMLKAHFLIFSTNSDLCGLMGGRCDLKICFFFADGDVPRQGPLKNKGIGWLAALQLSSTFFNHVEAEMVKTLRFFSHVSSLGGIFKASFCTAWANSKFRKCVFVEAKLSFFPRWKKVWNLTFEVTNSMFSQSHAGQQLILQLFHKHFDYPYLYPHLSVWLSIYLSKILMYPCCGRYVQGQQKKSMWNHSNIFRQRNTNHMLAWLPRHVLA